MKNISRSFVLSLALFSAPLPALAHKVIASVFPSGAVIEGEIGFSNGDMATNTAVHVSDENGTDLGTVKTDEDGFFTFTPTEAVTHIFYANLGAGHVAEVDMSAEEVAKILGVAAQSAATEEVATPAPNEATPRIASLTQEERAAIAEVVRDEMRPLRREIAAYKEHNDFQTILGGIGYIIGLFGIGFYIAARRERAAK